MCSLLKVKALFYIDNLLLGVHIESAAWLKLIDTIDLSLQGPW